MTGYGPSPTDEDDPFLAEHERFRYDDASYLLGALDEAGCAAFEAHLRGCPLCQDAITELADLPRLLERADSSAWQPQPEPPPDTLLPRLLAQVVAARRRRAWQTATAGLVAACLAAVLVLAVGTGWPHHGQAPALTMQALGSDAGSVHATVRLTGAGTSTRIQLDCGYYGSASYPSTAPAPSYRMVVFNRHGQLRDLGSWTPQPGEDVRIDRMSPWARQNLSKIEISDATGRPLLRLTL